MHFQVTCGNMTLTAIAFYERVRFSPHISFIGNFKKIFITNCRFPNLTIFVVYGVKLNHGSCLFFDQVNRITQPAMAMPIRMAIQSQRHPPNSRPYSSLIICFSSILLLSFMVN